MYYIGLDIGTTGAKAILVDKNGRIISKSYRGYALLSNGCRIEQKAQDWISAGAAAVREIMDGNHVQVDALSLSAQGASTVAVDKSMQPIGNALTWMDYRATKEASEIKEAFGEEYIYKMSGWRINASFDAAKILWMKRQPEYMSARMYLSTIDFANYFLTGKAVIDPTSASIRQLYSIENADWDDKILVFIGISREELPECLKTGTFIGGISESAAHVTGLQAGTPVYNGAHDQYCASIGADAVKAGDILLSAGTTWVIMGISDKPLYTDTYIAPCSHPAAGLYGNIASLTCSGASMEWFKNEFTSGDFDEINEKAAGRTKKTGELFFYPYMSGANYPLWNIAARGAFTGIELSHNRYDFALAIMEGVAFGVRSALEDFNKNGFIAGELKIMGGAVKSKLWRGLIADAADITVKLAESEACALGAAIIAACGSGVYSDYTDACKSMVACQREHKPRDSEVIRLDEKYKHYRKMWSALVNYYK